MPDRGVFGAGVVLGDPDHGGGEGQTDDGTGKHAAGGDLDCAVSCANQPGGHRVVEGEGKYAGNDQALVQGPHDLAAVGGAYEIAADNGSDDRYRAQGERIENERFTQHVRCFQHQRAEHHGGDDRDDVRFEQIGGHAGAVADVVTDVVGDDRRVARVVLGDAGLHFADQVGAHVGAFGEDATAEPGKDGNQG